MNKPPKPQTPPPAPRPPAPPGKTNDGRTPAHNERGNTIQPVYREPKPAPSPPRK